jgi:hypothetical protein
MQAHLSHGGTDSWLYGLYRTAPGLRKAAGERGADGGEGGVQARTQGLQSSGCAESHESDDQGILDEVLTFFADHQGLHLDKQLKHEVVHFYSFSPLG